MSLYSYKLNKGIKEENSKTTYKEKDIKLMTTFQLREICNKEKLVKSIVNPLDKEELIALIMKYRGEPDNLLIDEYINGGIERIESFLKKCEKNITANRNINYPGKITVYEELDMNIYDDYLVSSEEKIEEGNALLVDDNFKVSTVFNIKKTIENNKEKYFLTKSREIPVKKSEGKHYSLLILNHQGSEALYNIYQGDLRNVAPVLKAVSLPILELEIKEVKETTMPLAIDFGTSNTTAGIYIDKESFSRSKEIQNNENHNNAYEGETVSLVKFMDLTTEEFELKPMIPSVVGIKNITANSIEYVFGFEALAEAKKRYIEDGFTIFYDIKRWISDYEKMEKVIDVNEKVTFIKRKDIIKAFLEHVIAQANHRFKRQFKNIYISCPSKQKHKFHSLFKEILSDYKVDSENMLEESVAVLYNTLSDLIEKNKYEDGEKYKALIIDCGGGTTDLSGCTFSISNERISYKLDIETSYENGDTDFGGNNLTFRILQFIKILMAQEMLKENHHLRKAIIDEFNIDIFRSVDKDGINKLYECLEKEYQLAEAIIPTQFQLYENRNKEEYCKVKSNYYFLFDLAENVKKMFFTNPDLLKVTLTPKTVADKVSEEIIYDKWKLSWITDGTLQSVKEAPMVTLNVYEITTLIKGDIYNIIKFFLEKLYQEDELYEYSLIKLTGQSCTVDIFKDALKEFIPGRIIEVNRSKKEDKDRYELKLACIKGALKYLHSRNFGYIDVSIENKTPTMPYLITAFTHTGDEKILLKGKQRSQGFISRFMDRIMLKLYLKASDDSVKYEYTYKAYEEDLKITNESELAERYPNISQHETDNIENNEIKFFVWAEEELWGFYVLGILRREEDLYIAKEQFFYFENDQWERNFFDGLK